VTEIGAKEKTIIPGEKLDIDFTISTVTWRGERFAFPPIDSVFGDVGDLEGLRTWAMNSRALGFEGMGCVHPTQIPMIHEAFAPSAAEIERARKIVAAYDEAQEKGLGVVSLGSKMIDAPVVQRALKLMARAKAMGLVP